MQRVCNDGSCTPLTIEDAITFFEKAKPFLTEEDVWPGSVATAQIMQTVVAQLTIHLHQLHHSGLPVFLGNEVDVVKALENFIATPRPKD